MNTSQNCMYGRCADCHAINCDCRCHQKHAPSVKAYPLSFVDALQEASDRMDAKHTTETHPLFTAEGREVLL